MAEDLTLDEIANLAREIAEGNLKIMQERQGTGKSEKVLGYLKNWRNGGIKELSYIVLWKVYRLSLKYKIGFLLKPFALYYAKREHFGSLSQWGYHEV